MMEDHKILFDQMPSAELIRKQLMAVMSESRKLRAMLKAADAIEKENKRKQQNNEVTE